MLTVYTHRDTFTNSNKHTHKLPSCKNAHTQARFSPQKTPQATPERPWRLCWSSMATADIAPHSLFILSVLGPARFTYSPLHRLAANRLWTSRLSIMEASLTVLWQAHWIDSSDPLFIFACLACTVTRLGLVFGSLAWIQGPATHPPPLFPLLFCLNPPNRYLSQHPTSHADRITRVACFPLLLFFFRSYLQHDDGSWMTAAGESDCRINSALVVQT